MSQPIVSIDSSEIREGKLDEVKRAMKELVEFAESNEPRPFAYNVYFDDREASMTVVQIHPDSASLELHMQIAAERFRGFGSLLKLLTLDVYGSPSEELLMLLRRKAQMLGGVDVSVHAHHAGFTRFGIRAPA